MPVIDVINTLALDKVELYDRPYLLYINTPTPTVTSQLAFRYTADLISYRENLIERHTSISKSQSLNLQFHCDRELEAIKPIALIEQNCAVSPAETVRRWHNPLDLLEKAISIFSLITFKFTFLDFYRNRFKFISSYSSMVKPLLT